MTRKSSFYKKPQKQDLFKKVLFISKNIYLFIDIHVVPFKLIPLRYKAKAFFNSQSISG